MDSGALDRLQIPLMTMLLKEYLWDAECTLCHLINSTVLSTCDLANLSDIETIGSYVVLMAGTFVEQGDVTSDRWRRYGDVGQKSNSGPVGT